MDGYKLGVVETHFAELIWQHEPLTSGELVKLCEQELQWKKIHDLHSFEKTLRTRYLSERKRHGHFPSLTGGL